MICHALGRTRFPIGPRALLILGVLAPLGRPPDAAGQEPAQLAAQVDSLRAELERLNRLQVERIQQVVDAHRGDMERTRREIQTLLEANEARVTDLRRTLEEATRGRLPQAASREAAWTSFEATRGRLPQAASREAAWTSFEAAQATLAALQSAAVPPLVVGQRFVAGAGLAPLNPSLARYFAVDSGVLVTEVTERSPGAEAGLVPGDVLVEVAGQPVRNVQEVRAGFSRLTVARGIPTATGGPAVEETDEGIPIRVVREGRSMELIIPR